MAQLRSVTCHMGSHSVTCYPTQVNTPRLNPSHAGRYSIYPPRWDGRLSWPSWLDSAPARSQTGDLTITSPTLNHCSHQDNHWYWIHQPHSQISSDRCCYCLTIINISLKKKSSTDNIGKHITGWWHVDVIIYECTWHTIWFSRILWHLARKQYLYVY